MKILQICPPWIPVPPRNYGGTELVIHNLVEELVKEGHEVTVFATGDSKTFGNVKYIFKKALREINVPWNAALPAIIHYDQAFELAEREYFDIVHTHLSSDTDPIMYTYLTKLKVSHIMTVHGHFPYDRYSGTDEYFFKLYGHKINAVSLSKTMEKALPSAFNSYGVAYNGIDLRVAEFKAKPQDYYAWLGKIVPYKGLHEGILAAKQAGIKLVIAGVIDQDVKESIEYFKTKVEPYIDDKQIKYIGPVNLKDKNKLFKNAKAFLNPINWAEPFGLVMIEAMACGTPVISFARGAATEIIEDGKTGFLVKDVDGMVNAIRNIDQINREDCRKRVENSFSSQAMAKKYTEIYKQVIRSTKKTTILPKVIKVKARTSSYKESKSLRF